MLFEASVAGAFLHLGTDLVPFISFSKWTVLSFWACDLELKIELFNWPLKQGITEDFLPSAGLVLVLLLFGFEEASLNPKCVLWRFIYGATFLCPVLALNPFFCVISFGCAFVFTLGSESPMHALADMGLLLPPNLASCLQRNSVFLYDRNALSFSICFWINARYFSSWFCFWFLSASVCLSCSVAKEYTNVTDSIVE